MIRLPNKQRNRTLPWMVMVSLLAHGVMVCAVLVISARWLPAPKPPEIRVPALKLVASKTMEPPPEPEKLLKTPTSEPEPVQALEQIAQIPAAALEQKIVQPKSLKREPKGQIKTAKNRREPKRVELPEEAPAVNTEKEQKPDKQDPEKQIEQRVAAIREKLQHKAAESPAVADDKSLQVNNQGRGSESTADQELGRWVEEVKHKVNENWTVMGFSRVTEDRSTLIGLTLTREGQLKTAYVDKSSGDEVFDGSAMKAVHQAIPFPQLSQEAVEKIGAEGGLAIMFTPRGIR
jgi:colicin import membrane protein